MNNLALLEKMAAYLHDLELTCTHPGDMSAMADELALLEEIKRAIEQERVRKKPFKIWITKHPDGRIYCRNIERVDLLPGQDPVEFELRRCE